MKIKIKLYFYISISIMIATLIPSGLYFSKYCSEIHSGITARLTIGTEIAKGEINYETISSMSDPAFKDSDLYKDTLKQLKEQEQAFGFKSVYYLIRENGKTVTTYDSSNYPKPDNSGDTFMTAYIDAPEAAAQAFDSEKITSAEYADKWGTFRSIFNPVKNSEGKVIGVMGADYEMSVVKEKLRSAYVILAIIILLGAALSAGVVYVMNIVILKPILRIADDISTITENADLTKRTAVKRSDEIGTLASCFNGFMNKSSSIIGQIEETSLKLAAASEELASISSNFTTTTLAQAENSKDVVTSIATITDLINFIVQRSGEQLEIFISQRKLIGDLYTGIAAVNGQAEKTLGLSNTVSVHAREGEESLSTMNRSMDKVMQSSNDMIGIIEIINDISDRINLLSLNAAIEAARAGNAGRGFAVVSEEISKLADQTASSTKNIDALIKTNSEEIQREIENLNSTTIILRQIISGVEEMRGEVSTIQQSSKEQIVTAEKVRSNAGNIYKRAEDIKASADSQKNELDRITQSIVRIEEHTTAVITGSEEIAASAEDIAGTAELLQGKVSTFKL